jgi:hypothetical protein
MKHYELEETSPVIVPDYVHDQIIKDYIQRRYTGAIIIATFIIGFLSGVLAYAL